MRTLIRTFLFIGILVSANYGCKQNDSNGARNKKDKEGNCILNTSDISNANGINMDVYYPCSWIQLPVRKNSPMLIKQFAAMPLDAPTSVALSVAISEIDKDLNPGANEKLRSEVYITDEEIIADRTISTDTLEINGIKGGAIVTRDELPSGQIAYGLMIQLYFKDKLVQFIYQVGSFSGDAAKMVFEENKPLFMKLARKTKIYN